MNSPGKFTCVSPPPLVGDSHALRIPGLLLTRQRNIEGINKLFFL